MIFHSNALSWPGRWLLPLLGLYSWVNHSLHTPGQAGGAAAIAGGGQWTRPLSRAWMVLGRLYSCVISKDTHLGFRGE